ncbi:hypothetical protein TVAG_249250 [Trichomonas vaginalis G3]|uniref:Uncharacterized protein n=1 Tax=Trichomonas vaginalis (strain ATCC PRA-98 / G3) TaxID=412133 RepID=A2DCC8_TRIV3|nr:hypothetical protein TVAGG3_0957500 [Trichomonas vaginalis G3]EAY21865.1 hypothetical protein TVAG_249250 [Trichomonas vaginalis G3]KAI5487661.1 hypothetical protein TVAGG3_0957500 [Trichomonas vaginalis G3]|eukprot:XP_001582851.1 hypothetical protein [Trichomonas vaginalis G3]
MNNYSRFFDKVRILTPKEIDQLIEEAKSAIEKIHQFVVFYSDDKNKFASAFKVKQQFMELAQLVSLIESKTYSIKNMVSFNDNLTVESVSTKCDEYLKAAKTAVSFSPQIQLISNNYEKLISNMKELKEDMQDAIENIEQIRKESSSQDSNQNMAGNIESRIRQVEDGIAICNALHRAQNQDYSSELKDIKNLFSQFAKRISAPNDVPTGLLNNMIKQTMKSQLSEKIEETEFDYAKILAERSSKSIGKAAVDKSKEIAVNFAAHTPEKIDFSKSMLQTEQNIKKHIDKLNKQSAKPESIDKLESKTKELDQRLSSQISKLQKLNNVAKDESTSVTQSDIDRVCTVTSILPQIENSILQSATILSPYLSSIEKYTNKVQDQIKTALNGQTVNFDQISQSQLEKGDPFTRETAEKQLNKLIKAERSRGNTSDLNFLSNSIEKISKSFDKFEGLHAKVDELQRMQKVLNRKANETTTKLPKFAPEDASANAKSIPNLESKLNSLKKKLNK